MNKPLAGFCSLASIASILFGGMMIVVPLSSRMSMNWGAAFAEMTAQAVIIAGGLISLAILSTRGGS